MAVEFRGVYENGMVRPTEPVSLPDGTRVEFHPVATNGAPGAATPIEELERLSRRARANRSIEEIIAERGVKPLESIHQLRMAGMENDDVDEFLRLVREGRR